MLKNHVKIHPISLHDMPLSPLPLSNSSLTTLESKSVWQALNIAHRYLAELKGLCESLPNPDILIDTLSIQEAKDSSEIENIITTHDELYSSQHSQGVSAAAKEVNNYTSALKVGYQAVSQSGLIRLETILAIQSELEKNNAGLRQLPGTVLLNESTGATVYEPPQDARKVSELMDNLISFIHADDDLDPLLRMAITHHQFESIHPFYDGNGRTGRILNIMILIREGLLDLPVLYLSRFITTHKEDYYRLLQSTRDSKDGWETWCLYFLKGIELTSKNEIQLIRNLRTLMLRYKTEIRSQLPKIYSQDLLNTLFRYPYTKIDIIERQLAVTRPTATKYLDLLAEGKWLTKQKQGRTNFYINTPLYNLLTQIQLPQTTPR